MTIWKFELDPDGTIEIPCMHRVLSVGMQGEKMVCWALVNPQSKTTTKQLKIVGTGWTGWYMDDLHLDSKYRFIGTVQMPDGLVFHVFDKDMT